MCADLALSVTLQCATVSFRYVQAAQVTHVDELELLVAPSAIVPVTTFLKDHSACEFKIMIDIAGADFPTRKNRFEVRWTHARRPWRHVLWVGV